MRTVFLTLSALTLSCLLSSCTSSKHNASTGEKKSATDKIDVLAMHVAPQRPVAGQPWKVIMEVRNLTHQPLMDVRYEFLLNGEERKKLGVGKVPRIDPGQTVEVHGSFGTVLSEGSYHIRGRVFVDKTIEPYRDWQNNWSSVAFTIAK